MHKSLSILQERANIYETLGSTKERSKDLQDLADAKVRNSLNLEDLAALKIEKEGVTPQAITLLRQSVAVNRSHSQSPLAAFYPDTHVLYDLNEPYSFVSSFFPHSEYSYKKGLYDLIVCGDLKTAQNILKEQKESDRERLFQAIIAREMGNEKNATSIFSKLVEPNDSDLFHCPELWRIYVLCALDQSNIPKAEKLMKDLKENGERSNFAEAWLLYEKGNYVEALKKADKFCVNPDDDDAFLSSSIDANDLKIIREVANQWYSSIPSYQSKSAMQLLRHHIFLKLNQPAKAGEAMMAYQKSGCTGTIFIPKVYRKWVTESQVNRHR